MPKEGFKSVTIKAYVLDRAERYFEDHKAEFRKKGIKSSSALCSFCIEHVEMLAKSSDLLRKT